MIGDSDAGAGEEGDGAPPAPSSRRTQDRIGQVVAGCYRIEAVVAVGAFGVTYRAEDVEAGLPVALRVLHSEMEDLPDVVERFECDYSVGAYATHPNVGATTDCGRLEDGSPFFVLEHIDGISLHELIQRGPVPAERAVDIARQIAEGLHAIHQLDIVHRDLKPRNVMVSEQPPDVVKLINFGCAQLPPELLPDDEDDAAPSSSDEPIGTVGFMAPEVTFGMHAVGPASDLYALGVILYEMLTGKHPYDEMESASLFLRHQLYPPPTFAKRAPECDVPPALEELTMRLLAKAPEDRPADAGAVVASLEAAARSNLAVEPDASPAEVSDADTDSDVMDISQVVDQRDSIELLDETPSAFVPSAPAKPRSSTPPAPAPTPAAQRDVERSGKRRRTHRFWRASIVVLLAVLVLLLLVPSLRARVAAWISGDRSTPLPRAPSGANPTTAPRAAAATSHSAASPGTSSPSSRTARPTSVDGIDAEGWRRQLRTAVQMGAVEQGVRALQAVAAIDPELFAESQIAKDTVAIAVTLSRSKGTTDDGLFSLLTSAELGEAGPDILYRLATGRGGSAAAQRANELLERDDVRRRASPPLRLALGLADAPCADKPAMFDRVLSEGDLRALTLLRQYRPPGCTQGGGCCLSHNPRYQTTVLKLSTRLAATRER